VVQNGDLDINDDKALLELARTFGVSQQALIYRLVNLGVDVGGGSSL
jgi:Zn-dependent peptidase ImmA (M78 family)